MVGGKHTRKEGMRSKLDQQRKRRNGGRKRKVAIE
jgi:hypothetical protein